MPDDRTPPWLIQLRFFLMCSPVGIIAAILLAPFALPLLLGFGITLFLFWHGSRLFTNTFVWFFDPAGYQQLQERGIDPFYNSLGTPLNNDSDTVRMYGQEPNQGNDTDELCPECWEPVCIQRNENSICLNCNARWHNNQWWKWDGAKWQHVHSM